MSVVIGISTEPQCTPFSYQEQLLEKMIRTEIKFEDLQNRLTNELKEFKNDSKTFLESAGQQIEHKTAAFVQEFEELSKIVKR